MTVSHNQLQQPSLSGRVIRSERQPGVYYQMERRARESRTGTSYLSLRKCSDGASPVVIKVLNTGAELSPEILAVKEAVSLGRLNEALPPCPFVVRLVDAGTTRFGASEPVPWLAIEYVHGGIEGTTLTERVHYSLERTGFAFDPRRAAHLVRCLTAGLSAIHDASILHRDLTPDSVHCCGFGAAEIFKIADLGVARPTGLAQTFTGLPVGTPGYVAPEASTSHAGPTADVFSLATLLYYVLTGHPYFEGGSPEEVDAAIASPRRQSLMLHATLAPELAERPEACEELDAVLARATHASPAERWQTARELGRAALPWLGGPESAPRSIGRHLTAVQSARHPIVDVDYRWTVRCHPQEHLVLQSAAWDADGHALGLSPDGAWFWNGVAWVDASHLLAGLTTPPTFVRRYEAGGWLVGGRGGQLCVVGASGVHVALPAPSFDCELTLASGRVGDLLVAVESRSAWGPVLWCSSSSHWLRPFAMPGVAQITALQRIDDHRWLVGGRLRQGVGFAAIYSPLTEEVKYLPTPELRAFIAGASAAERSVALLVGSDGVVLRLDGQEPTLCRVPGNPDLAAVGLDVMDYEWATSLGQIFGRDRRAGEQWHPHWRDPSWTAPFISVMADVGWVLAMTADGAILEGKTE